MTSPIPDPDPTVRRNIIREICRAEGHGKLRPDGWVGTSIRLACPRDCGITVYEVDRSVSLDELPAYLDAPGAKIYVRGTVEVES